MSTTRWTYNDGQKANEPVSPVASARFTLMLIACGFVAALILVTLGALLLVGDGPGPLGN